MQPGAYVLPLPGCSVSRRKWPPLRPVKVTCKALDMVDSHRLERAAGSCFAFAEKRLAPGRFPRRNPPTASETWGLMVGSSQ